MVSLMHTTLRRLLLLFCVVRFGVRELWRVAPGGHKLHWFTRLLGGLHASPGARATLHRALPELGPVASLFAQTLVAEPQAASSTLHDILDRYAALQGALVTPLAPDAVLPALHAALGQPVDAIFESVVLVPCQNGIAEQVHAARLRHMADLNADDTPNAAATSPHVVVKFVRPRQIRRITDDLAVLDWLARLLEKFVPTARALHVHDHVQSLAGEILRRFDLRAEAANLSQTARHFADDPRVAVPNVVWEGSTDSALTLQRIDTCAITDIDALRRHGVHLGQLGTRLVEVVVEQAFEHGFFHAALDARRVRVSIEPATLGAIVFADGALMTSLTEPEREFFVHGASALFEQDYDKLADMHRDSAHVHPATRPEVLAAELRTRSEIHFAMPCEARRAGAVIAPLFDGAHALGGSLPSALTLAHDALTRAETLARAIAPELDTWSIVKGVLGELARKDVDHRGWIKRIARELPHLAPIVPRLPGLFVRRLQAEHARRDAAATAHVLAELRQEAVRTRRLLWACAAGGVLIGAGFVFLMH
jgi:ubiquinone biosynthesis protein